MEEKYLYSLGISFHFNQDKYSILLSQTEHTHLIVIWKQLKSLKGSLMYEIYQNVDNSEAPSFSPEFNYFGLKQIFKSQRERKKENFMYDEKKLIQ